MSTPARATRTLDGRSPTLRQLQYLQFIANYIDTHQWAPTVRVIMAELGVRSTNAVSDQLRALVRMGLLEREHGSPRAMRITEVGWSFLEPDDPYTSSEGAA